MGKGEPWYGDLVYLVAHPPTQCAVPMTTTQVEMFHPDNSRAYAIDEALICLDQPRLTAEVSQLRDGLVRVEHVTFLPETSTATCDGSCVRFLC